MITSKRNRILLPLCIVALSASALSPASAARMIGYWESYGSLQLSAVSTNYDVVAVAFALTSGKDNATITFAPSVETAKQVATDVTKLQARGQKVVLSIGGQTANNLELLNNADVKAFEKSVEKLINKYGFDGIDLDLENATLSLQAGDNNFMHPTTPTIVNLIKACKALAKKYGPAFMITMAPETLNIDAYGSYGGQYGSYLPVIYGLGSNLAYVATQCYNSGSQYGRDGGVYDQGTPDFCVAMADLLLGGYKLANGQQFPPLAQSQVAFGIPATAAAAPGGGYMVPSLVLEAAQYIGSHTNYSGRTYTLSSPTGYPDFAGVMCFDINYDQANNLAMSSALDSYLHSIGGDEAFESQ
ncbi:MAG TPA: glycosyl hydrolase family 18 protein [Chthoniobacterales bacterium]|jgi:chitinase